MKRQSLRIPSFLAIVLGMSLACSPARSSGSDQPATQPQRESTSPDEARVVTATKTGSDSVPVGVAGAQEGIASASLAVERASFRTRYGYFQAANWGELPGWSDDDLPEAWAAFRNSCTALGRKSGWDGPCVRAKTVNATSNTAIRRFFEDEFVLYEIRNTDRTPEGVITGYYEPLIHGSRMRSDVYRFPVYATPDDLLILDSRRLPRGPEASGIPARVEGRSVIPMPDASEAPYVIHIGSSQADVRDKKLRVRIDGDQIVPYPARAEIQRYGLPKARVLLWVDNLAAFYSMQIQGSGKVRLPNGETVRLAYAEQNGHPFSPPVRRKANGEKTKKVTTRGLNIELADVEEDWGEDASDGVEPAPALRTRGFKPSPSAARAGAQRSRKDQQLTAEVESMVEQLMSGNALGSTAKTGSMGMSKPVAGTKQSAERRDDAEPKSGDSGDQQAEKKKQAAGSTEVTSFPQPSHAVLEGISADPSYVFFREIPDGPGGPIGALGVPLTAGRSVAVDPRTTPLGFPVFVATLQPGRKGTMNRLVMAQDTGGAIRGAVRADYFWGFGAKAYAQAAYMKESGRMWLLSPRGQQIAARDSTIRTRSLDVPEPSFDCLVSDPDLCVE